MKLLYVPNDAVVAAWPHIIAHLEKGRQYWEEYYDEASLLREVKEGRLQMWMAVERGIIRLVCLTEITDYPKVRVLRVLWIAGEGIREGIKMLEQIEAWAQTQGVRKVEISGRRGWRRLLPRLGFREEAIRFGKSLARVSVH